MSTAALEIGDALVAALKADAALATALGATAEDSKIYSGRAPDTAVLPYIVLGASTETARGTFGRDGTDGVEMLHLWTDGPFKRPVLVLYAHVHRVLDRVALTLSTNTHTRGRVRLVTTMIDPGGTAHHGVAEYRAHTQAGAA